MDAQRAKFARQMIQELHRSGDAGPFEVDEESFRLVRGDGSFLNLHNAFAEWERTSRLRRRFVTRHFAASLAGPLEPPSSIEEARANLMPRVGEPESYETMRLQFPEAREGKGLALTVEPINDELTLEVVYDWPTAVTPLTPERLDGWGITTAEAIRTARANLREHTPGTFERLEPGVFGSPWHDTYDAARLVLTELVTRLELEGDPVALLPHRDELFLTGSDHARGLGRIAELAAPFLDDTRRVTGRAFCLRDGAWAPYVPPDGHPQHRRFLDLRRVSDAAGYGEQKAVLEQRARLHGEEVFVAPVLVAVDDETGETTTFCSWTEGVPTLLPRADRIAFVSPGETQESSRVVYVRWDEATAVLAGAMTPQGLLPERWLVDRFPEGSEYAALERAQVGWRR